MKAVAAALGTLNQYQFELLRAIHAIVASHPARYSQYYITRIYVSSTTYLNQVRSTAMSTPVLPATATISSPTTSPTPMHIPKGFSTSPTTPAHSTALTFVLIFLCVSLIASALAIFRYCSRKATKHRSSFPFHREIDRYNNVTEVEPGPSQRDGMEANMNEPTLHGHGSIMPIKKAVVKGQAVIVTKECPSQSRYAAATIAMSDSAV